MGHIAFAKIKIFLLVIFISMSNVRIPFQILINIVSLFFDQLKDNFFELPLQYLYLHCLVL